MSQPLMTLSASPPRRMLAAFVFVLLGGGLLFMAALRPPAELVWLAFLIATGALALWGGWRLWLATQMSIELRQEGLFLSDGASLAPVEMVLKVERGAFAFKPSNGFMVRLRQPIGKLWYPGIVWRFGRSLGVGGVTSAAQGKAMADALAAMVAARAEDASEAD